MTVFERIEATLKPATRPFKVATDGYVPIVLPAVYRCHRPGRPNFNGELPRRSQAAHGSKPQGLEFGVVQTHCLFPHHVRFRRAALGAADRGQADARARFGRLVVAAAADCRRGGVPAIDAGAMARCLQRGARISRARWRGGSGTAQVWEDGCSRTFATKCARSGSGGPARAGWGDSIALWIRTRPAYRIFFYWLKHQESAHIVCDPHLLGDLGARQPACISDGGCDLGGVLRQQRGRSIRSGWRSDTVPDQQRLHAHPRSRAEGRRITGSPSR